MTTRDPLTNPIPGDIVAKGKLLRFVKAVSGYDIWWAKTPDQDAASRMCYISTWREWCSNARVVQRAEEAT